MSKQRSSPFSEASNLPPWSSEVSVGTLPACQGQRELTVPKEIPLEAGMGADG